MNSTIIPTGLDFASQKQREELQHINLQLAALGQPTCEVDGDGYLEIHIYTRPDGTFYYRMCNNCSKRTKGQRYEPSKVRGIVKNIPDDPK